MTNLHRKSPAIVQATTVTILLALCILLAGGGAPGTVGAVAHAAAAPSGRNVGAPADGVNPSPTPADIDGDGKDEVVCGSGNALVCWNSDGSQRWAADTGARVVSSAACWDVNGCGRMEMFVGNDAGWVYGFDSNGRVLSEWGWPKASFAGSAAAERGVVSSPSIGDIDGDGTMEVVVGSWSHLVWAWHCTGPVVAGFPVDVCDTIWSSPALGDVNRDGRDEIVIGADCTAGAGWPYPSGGLLFILDGAGRYLPGWPKWTPQVIWSSPALADLRGTGNLDIIVGSGIFYEGVDGNHVYALDVAGNNLPGWPVNTSSKVFSSPAVGDVNADGRLEVVAGDINGSVYTWAPDGRTLGAVSLPCPLGSAALGDTTGDGLPDINYGPRNAPAVGDFDRDGMVEIATETGIQRKNVKYKKGAFPWPMFRHDSRHTGCFAEPQPLPPAPDFEAYIVLQNPNNEPAGVTLTYMMQGGDTKNDNMVLKPNSRSTVFVNDAVGYGKNVSTKVTSDRPIICERPMYFNYRKAWTGGHDVMGANAPSSTFYFAEGTCRPNFDPYICIQNPGEADARVDITYMKGDGTTREQSLTVARQSRSTVVVKDTLGQGDDKAHDFSCKVETKSKSGIICERSLYFNYGGAWTGGHDVMGATEPASTFYFAEGTCRPGFEPYLCIQNPGSTEAKVKVTYMKGDGTTAPQALTVPARTRSTVVVKNVLGQGDDPAHDFSCKVETTNGTEVVCERPMYFNYQGFSRLNWTGGHDVMGASEPAPTFYFAEGTCRPGFDPYLCIQNPGNSQSKVRITYMKGDGTTQVQTLSVGAHSRSTVVVKNALGEGNDPSHDFSCKVETTNGVPLVCERPMYFNYKGAWTGGHDAIGALAPSTTWYFAEGYTGS
ncbi:MAG: FG-GAP-like repeat-containing protein [Candidatus Geothermincolia bacterium]